MCMVVKVAKAFYAWHTKVTPDEITILARYLDNITFFLGNVLNYLHFYCLLFRNSRFLSKFSYRFIFIHFYPLKTAVRAVESS